MKLTILHTNDVHASYDGWLRCASHIKRRRAELGSGNCLVADAGDHFDMSVDECGLTGGQLHLDLLADAGVEAFSPGNNEFYRSPRAALEGLSSSSPFHWLATTVSEQDGKPFAGMRHGVVIDKAGIRIGLLGALDPMEEAVERLHGLKTLPAAHKLQEEATRLRAEGAGLVVLVSHLGLRDDLALAREIAPGTLDVIVGGHSHKELHEALVEGGCVIVQAGERGRFVGELELDVQGGKLAGYSYRLVDVSGESPDSGQLAIMARHGERVGALLDEELCVLGRGLDAVELRRLAAELLKRKFGAELGMVAGPAATDGLKSGILRKGDIYAICRSFLTPAAFSISGSQLLGLLRERLDPAIFEDRGYGVGFRPSGLPFGKLEFSGLSWEDSPAGPVGARIGGEPLDPARRYRVGSLTHLYGSESGRYPSLDGSSAIEFTRFRYLRDELADAFRSGLAAGILSGAQS